MSTTHVSPKESHVPLSMERDYPESPSIFSILFFKLLLDASWPLSFSSVNHLLCSLKCSGSKTVEKGFLTTMKSAICEKTVSEFMRKKPILIPRCCNTRPIVILISSLCLDLCQHVAVPCYLLTGVLFKLNLEL